MMVIKQATVQDAKTISHIYASSWKSAYKGIISQQYLDELQEDHWVDAFQSWIEAGTVTALLIYDNELPVGCIAYGKSRDEKLPEWGEIISIYLIPGYFGKGYGYKLLNAALDDMKNAGYGYIYLWVLEENKTAQEFYMRNGFSYTNDKDTFEIKNKPFHHIRYAFSFNNKSQKEKRMKYLIVVDMQNDFIDGALGTAEAMEIVDKVAGKVRKAQQNGVNIIFTQDTHPLNYLETQEGRNLPVKHCIDGTGGWKIHDSLTKYAENSLIFTKNTFGSKLLAEYLHNSHLKNPIDEIELCGLCTDICVISNALLIKAFLPETEIKVDANCCAGVSPETHNNALAVMRVCQINITGSINQ